MKYILKTCSNNEHWGANYLLVELTPAILAQVRGLQEKCITFLKEIGSPYYGRVFLEDDACPFTVFDALENPALETILEAADWMEDVDWMVVPQDTEVEQPCRTECHSVRFGVGGSVWLHAISKDSSDFVEAKLSERLIAAVHLQHPMVGV